ncbi:MAG TPA: hypothetical protein VK184_25095 [Nostocaceae cyanobacterium]|nr:hypothetical protein [Nostocaceae cyanobacterium]
MDYITEPLLDTWAWYNNGNSWGIDVPWNQEEFSKETINAYFSDSFNKTLEIFSNLMRVWKVTISPRSSSNVDSLITEWSGELPYTQYINDVLESIRDFPATIYRIEADLDLFIYVRTQDSPKKTVRTWVRLPNNELEITASIIKYIGLCLTIGYTIFGPANKDYSPLTGPYPEPEEDVVVVLDDNELQLLNQPLLEQALRKWEECFGTIDYVDGVPGIFQYGFLVEPY